MSVGSMPAKGCLTDGLQRMIHRMNRPNGFIGFDHQHAVENMIVPKE